MIFLSFQTTNFPPILIGELALRELRDSFSTKLGFRPTLTKIEINELMKSVESSLMILKYSYLSIEELINHEELINLHKAGELIKKAIKPAKNSQSTNSLTPALINWGCLILSGLGRRVKISDSQLGSGVDLKVVRVRNTQKRGDFLLTRAYDDVRAYTILTNIFELRTNQNFAVAFLPPREIDGQLSEAMYLGNEERSEEAGTFLAPNQVNLKEVNAILHQFIS